MSRPLQLTPWQGHLASRLPELPTPVVAVLALYSFGLILAKVSGLSTVALFLSQHLRRPYPALRKRLAEFYKEAPAKSGAKQGIKRKDFDVTTCFPPLLRWVLSLWSGQHLALAIDVTNLADRFHVLCVSVVVRGVGIPVAWSVLPGALPDPWNPHLQALRGRVAGAGPDGWRLVPLSDRGVEPPVLYRFLAGLGWHPLMRAKKGGKFCPAGWGRFYGLAELVRRPGASSAAEGRAYAGERMPCTLLARWDEGYAEPWLLLTTLPPEAARAVWYGLRAWVEQGFKLIKGGGWQWHKTRMEDPGRVERLWLVLAAATVWVVAVGAEEEARDRVREELRRWEQQMAHGQAHAQARRQAEALRRQRQQEALQARRERQERQQAARRQAQAKKPRARRAAKAAAVAAAAARQRTH